jgi:hypothetical protein
VIVASKPIGESSSDEAGVVALERQSVADLPDNPDDARADSHEQALVRELIWRPEHNHQISVHDLASEVRRRYYRTVTLEASATPSQLFGLPTLGLVYCDDDASLRLSRFPR